jgi:pentatricopeptide repeat protein
MPQKAINLFAHIDRPDEIAATVLFNACAQLKTAQALALGQTVYSRLPVPSRQSHLLQQAFFNILCRCHDIANAENLFERMKRDVVAYGSLMKAYNDQDQCQKTLVLWKRMKCEKIETNAFIYVLVVNACANIRFLSLCHTIARQIPHGWMSDPWIQTSLVEMWASDRWEHINKEYFPIIWRVSRASRVPLTKPSECSIAFQHRTM